MTINKRCPTCGTCKIKPLWPDVRTTPWCDECACSDCWTCFYHEMHPAEAPKRPSDEAMEERARVKFEHELHEWEEETAGWTS